MKLKSIYISGWNDDEFFMAYCQVKKKNICDFAISKLTSCHFSKVKSNEHS